MVRVITLHPPFPFWTLLLRAVTMRPWSPWLPLPRRSTSTVTTASHSPRIMAENMAVASGLSFSVSPEQTSR